MKLVKKIPVYICLLFTSFIFIYSLISTVVFDTVYNEVPITIKDNLIVNVFLIFCLLIVSYFFNKLLKNKKTYYKIKWLFIIIVLTFCLMLAFNVNTVPWYLTDQFYVSDIAIQLINGDYSSFLEGGYIHLYNNNLGFISFLSILYKIFGEGYTTIKVINAICCTGIYYFIVKVYEETSNNRSVYILVLFLISMFPVYILTTFIYNDIVSLFFIIVSLFFVVKYIKNSKIINIFLFIIFSCLAVLTRQNTIIFIIGFCIILILKVIVEKNIKQIVFIFLMIVSLFFTQISLKNYYEELSGYKLTGGAPKELHVAMGLQWTTEKPGWWNGLTMYPYIENNYDIEKTKNYAKKIINIEIDKMKSDYLYTIDFFKEKMLSQFNDPSYEVFDMTGTFSDQPNTFSKIIYYGKSNSIILKILNIIHSFNYLLMIICLVKLIKSDDISLINCLLITIYVGGFIFHVIWEAKSRYVLPYYIVMFPIIASSLEFLIEGEAEDEVKNI